MLGKRNVFFSIFFEILIHPKKIIQLILDKSPSYYVWPMVIIYSVISSLMDDAGIFLQYLNNSIPLLAFLMNLVLETGAGVFFFLLISLIVYQLGKWMGGKGSFENIMTAFAWGSIPPFFLGMLLNLIEVIPNYLKYLNGDRNTMVLFIEPLTNWHSLMSVLSWLIFIWAIILTLSTLSVVNKFNVGKWVTFFFVLFGMAGLLFIGISFYISDNQTEEVAQVEYEKAEAFFKQQKYEEAMWAYQGVETSIGKHNVQLLDLAQKKEWICRAYLNDWVSSKGSNAADIRLIFPDVYAKYKAVLAQITPVLKSQNNP